MKVLYYDCFAGISGDMNLGALLDLGVEEAVLRQELDKLGVEGYELVVKREKKMGIEGTRVTVKLQPHHHQHPHEHDHHHQEPHRNLTDIYEIIDNSTLSGSVKDRAKKMFLLIGKAEAKIHGKSLDEIHFHEVGAIDSIVDIVGAAICIDKLNVDKIMASRVEVGGGFVTCAHGTFPVPAPATAEILANIPIKMGTVEKETTTPTGASILAANVDEFAENHNMVIKKTGYGIGHRDLDIPNVLRVFLSETEEKTTPSTSMITECNIDDMNPELYDFVMDALLKAGANDVYVVPIQMKKNRPAVKLSVIHIAENTSSIEEILMKQTTTFGIRRYRIDKVELQRQSEEIECKGKKVRIKLGYLQNKIIKAKPEYDDCKRVSEELNVSILSLYRELNQLITEKYFEI